MAHTPCLWSVMSVSSQIKVSLSLPQLWITPYVKCVSEGTRGRTSNTLHPSCRLSNSGMPQSLSVATHNLQITPAVVLPIAVCLRAGVGPHTIFRLSQLSSFQQRYASELEWSHTQSSDHPSCRPSNIGMPQSLSGATCNLQ